MGPRTWAALGNVLRIFSLFNYLGGGVLGYRAIQLNQQGAPGNLVILAASTAGISFLVAILMWNAKGPLIRGNLIVQLIVGLYMLLWIIGTVGFALLFIGIVYLFTGEPESIDFYTRAKTSAPRFSAPANWHATGRVGPSGAMLYSSEQRDGAVSLVESNIPVQVVDKRNGYAHVVAATGQSGWIDLRTLTEPA